MSEKTNLSKIVREIQEEKKISSCELAKRLGITRQSLSTCLNGNPTMSRLKEIADALDVPVAELLK